MCIAVGGLRESFLNDPVIVSLRLLQSIYRPALMLTKSRLAACKDTKQAKRNAASARSSDCRHSRPRAPKSINTHYVLGAEKGARPTFFYSRPRAPRLCGRLHSGILSTGRQTRTGPGVALVVETDTRAKRLASRRPPLRIIFPLILSAPPSFQNTLGQVGSRLQKH